jgi:hypothetical protein
VLDALDAAFLSLARGSEGVNCYDLEVKAKYVESSKEDAENLAKDIAQHILSFYQHEIPKEELTHKNSFDSPFFHRLYTNLVDNDETLEKKVEELRKKYGLQRAMFHLTKQNC